MRQNPLLFVSYSLHVVFQLSALASIPTLIPFVGMLPCKKKISFCRNYMQSLRKGEHRNQTECLGCGNRGNQNLSFHCEVAELPPWLETKAILQPWCYKHTQNCEALKYSGIIPARALNFATNPFCMCIWGAADYLLIWYPKFGFWTGFLLRLGSSKSAYLPVSFTSLLLFMMPQ